MRYVVLDEKRFGQGHSYVSVKTDPKGGRVLEVSEDRTQASADQLWNTLPDEQRGQVRTASMDIWQPCVASRIQAIKSSARGLVAFANYRTRILFYFYFGKLDLKPDIWTHKRS